MNGNGGGSGQPLATLPTSVGVVADFFIGTDDQVALATRSLVLQVMIVKNEQAEYSPALNCSVLSNILLHPSQCAGLIDDFSVHCPYSSDFLYYTINIQDVLIIKISEYLQYD